MLIIFVSPIVLIVYGKDWAIAEGIKVKKSDMLFKIETFL